jgi:hypothetical protein
MGKTRYAKNQRDKYRSQKPSARNTCLPTLVHPNHVLSSINMYFVIAIFHFL